MSSAGSTRRVGWVLLLFAILAAFVSALVILLKQPDAKNGRPSTDAGLYVKVVESEVGETLNLPALAQWTVRAVPTPGISEGVVTDISVSTVKRITGGEVLFDLNQQPVTAWIGDVPSYRSFGLGDVGADVDQFISFLVLEGFLKADSSRRSFDRNVRDATRSWQRRAGLPESGRFEPQWFIFFPDLPVLVSVDAQVGDRWASDESVNIWEPDPLVYVDVGGVPATRLVAGIRAHLRYEKFSWEATIASVTAVASEDGTITSDGAVRVTLVSSGCICDHLPYSTEPVRMDATIDVVPPVKGATVPSSAIGADSMGNTFVLDIYGEKRPVVVLAQSDGRTVVKGLQPGQEVRAVVETSDTQLPAAAA